MSDDTYCHAGPSVSVHCPEPVCYLAEDDTERADGSMGTIRLTVCERHGLQWRREGWRLTELVVWLNLPGEPYTMQMRLV